MLKSFILNLNKNSKLWSLRIKTALKKRLKLFFKISVTVALLVYLIDYVSYEKIYQVILSANKYYILIVIILTILNIYLQFLKWRVICNSLLNIHVDRRIWYSLFYGFSAGLVTPVRVGEYLGRKYAFDDQSMLRVTISTIIEKFASLYIVLFLGGLVTINFITNFYSFIYSIPIILLLLALIFILYFIFSKRKISSITFNRLTEKYKFFKDLQLEFEYVKKLDSQSIKNLMRFSLIYYFVIIFQYALLAKAFDQSGDIILFLGIGMVVFFIKSLLSFLSFADLGIRESSSVFLLNKFGYSSSVGFNSAIFLFFFNLLIPSIIGMFLFLQKDKSRIN